MIKEWILINIITYILLVFGSVATENKEIAASYTIESLSPKMKWAFSDIVLLQFIYYSLLLIIKSVK